MSTRRGGSAVHAIVIADCVSPNSVLHQLSSNYKNTPLALLPVCNRPLIDYVIENLVQNEIRRITVLCANHVTQVQARVKQISDALETQQRRYVKGLESDTQSISVSCRASSTGNLRTLEHVFHELRSSLLHNEPFILVPMDCITNISNLKPLFDRHLARADAASKNGGDPVVFTAVVQQDNRSLKHALNSLMKDHPSYPTYTPALLEDGSGAEAVETPVTAQSPLNNGDWRQESMLAAAAAVSAAASVAAVRGRMGDLADVRQPDYLWGDSDDDEQEPPCLVSDYYDGSRSDAENDDSNDELVLTAATQVSGSKLNNAHVASIPRVTIAFDPTTQIAYGFQAWHEDDVNPAIALPKVKPGQRLNIRTDLVVTGLIICSPGVIDASAGPPTSVASLMFDLVVNYEAKKNRFAIDYAAGDSLFLPVSSLQSYVLANRAVSNRLLYPLTREAIFVGDKDDDTRYMVAMSSNHVALRRDFISVPVGIGGCCVLGGGIRVEADEGAAMRTTPTATSPTSTQHQLPTACRALVQESIIGDDVVLGNHCTIVGSVVMSGARVCDNVTIINSVVCANAHLGVRRADPVSSADRMVQSEDGGIHLRSCVVHENHVVLLPAGVAVSNHLLTSDSTAKDVGAPVLAPTGVITTQRMLLSDMDGSGSPMDEDTRWCQAVRAIVALFFDDEKRTSEDWVNSIFAKALGDKRLEFQKTNQDLICNLVHQLIVESAHRQRALEECAGGDLSPEAAGAQCILDIPDDEIDAMVGATKAIFDAASTSTDSTSSEDSDDDDDSSTSGTSPSDSGSEGDSASSSPAIVPPSIAVQLIKRLLCMWFAPVFCKFAPMDANNQKENSMAICMGIALGLNETCAPSATGPCLTAADANKIVGLMYSNLSDVLFEQQGYCIVPMKWLLTFDNFTEECVLDAQSDNVPLSKDIRMVVEGWAHAAVCIKRIREIAVDKGIDLNESDSDETDSDDHSTSEAESGCDDSNDSDSGSD